MAIKSAGTFLRISEIASEFNDPTPNAMSEFYRGGGKVNDVPDNSAVPTSGAVKIGDFYGAGNAVIVAASAATNLDVAPLFPGTFDTASTKILTIASPIQIVGNNVALTVPSNMAGTLDIQNAGNIIGSRGSAGSAGGVNANGGAGGAGGAAISIQKAGVTITNSGTINGGGGGGGGGAGSSPTSSTNTQTISFGPQSGGTLPTAAPANASQVPPGRWVTNFADINNANNVCRVNTPAGVKTFNAGNGLSTTRAPGNGGYVDRGPKINHPGNNSVGNKAFNTAGGNITAPVTTTTPGTAGGAGGAGYGFDGSNVANAAGGGNSPAGNGGGGGNAGAAGTAGGNAPATSGGSAGAAGNSITSPGSVNYSVSNSGTINGTQG
jgi:hypothetical protein|tara:strand:- start:957 stop:2096 length:1140 start_codon:yes stop_codon:yes gene_type:complete